MTGCKHTQGNECFTFKEIRFSTETKLWLNGQDWPQSAYVDFDKIGKHNEKWEQRCSPEKLNE